LFRGKTRPMARGLIGVMSTLTREAGARTSKLCCRFRRCHPTACPRSMALFHVRCP
jgi:hypothetical protein